MYHAIYPSTGPVMLVIFLQGKKLRLGRFFFFFFGNRGWLVFFVSLIQIRVIWEEGIPVEKNTSIKLTYMYVYVPGVFS